MAEDILGTREVARQLGITQRTVINLIKRGELEARQLGREWAITRQSLDAYIDREKRRADSAGDVK